MKKYFTAVLLLVAVQTLSQSLWTRKSDFPSQANGRKCGVSFSLFDKGYVGTGVGPGGTYLKDFWRYDPITDSWAQVQDLPGEARAFATAFVINDKAYVGTGQIFGENQSNTNDFYAYAPNNNSWSQILPAGPIGRYASVGFALNGKGYVTAGYSGLWTGLNTTWEFDPIASIWRQRADYPVQPGVKNASSFVLNNRAYVAGGTKEFSWPDRVAMTSTYEFIQSTNQWVQRASMPLNNGRSMAASLTFNNTAYLVGGASPKEGGSFFNYYKNALKYVQASDSWSFVSEAYPVGEIGGASGFTVCQKGYVTLGENSSGTLSKFTYEFNPPTDLSISGLTIICNSSTYQISNLLPGATVSWSLPANAGSVLQLSQNSPSTNQATITNQKWYSITTTLTATINIGCTNPIILTKTIANDNSTTSVQNGSYSQPGCYVNSRYQPPLSGSLPSNPNTPVYLHQGCVATITLAGMTGKTVTLEPGGVPTSWSYNSALSQLIFQLPLYSGGIAFNFKISGPGACLDKKLMFFSYLEATTSSMSVELNNETSVLTISPTVKDNDTELNGDEDETYHAVVFDLSNGKIVRELQISAGKENDVEMAGLHRGLYAIHINKASGREIFKFYKD
jgi:N-acetylneuraminic acid mutarotase